MDMNFDNDDLDYLSNLNEQQKEAVQTEHKRVCLIAGAGCGKTKTLISRILFLFIHKKIETNNILILTFSKKSIKEIKKRIALQTGGKKYLLHVYNFHSFCFNVLSRNYWAFGLKKFNVYDQQDQVSIIKKLILADSPEEVSLHSQNKYAKDRIEKKNINDLIKAISRFKNGKTKNVEEVFPKCRKLYEDYKKCLENNNALDFNDLIIWTLRLFFNFPFVCEKYKKMFSHILIDEAQDLNSIQWKIINILSGPEQNVFIVGDPNQTIFGFQGACSDTLSSFVQKDNWKTFFLNINYRSSPSILFLSNSFIELHKEMVQNKLVSQKEHFKEKVFRTSIFLPSSLIKLVKDVQKKDNLPWDEIAIIYRNNFISKMIEPELLRANIRFEVLGSYSFIEREEVKDALSLYRAILYRDDASLLRTLRWQRGIGPTTIEKIERTTAKEDNITIYNFFLKLKLNNEEIIKKDRTEKQFEIIFSLLEKLDNWKILLNDKENNEKLDVLLWTIIEDLNYKEHLEKKEDCDRRLDNIKHLIKIFSNWKKRRTKYNTKVLSIGGKEDLEDEVLHDFLQWVVLSFENKDLTTNKNSLILSSVHQSKGLEFEAVFFVYLNDGIIPSKYSEDQLEEKRVFYVGMTRAKRILFLINAYSTRCSSFLLKLDENENIKKKHYQILPVS